MKVLTLISLDLQNCVSQFVGILFHNSWHDPMFLSQLLA